MTCVKTIIIAILEHLSNGRSKDREKSLWYSPVYRVCWGNNNIVRGINSIVFTCIKIIKF